MDHNLILDLERCWMDSRNNKHGLIKFYGKIIKKQIHTTCQHTFDSKLRILLLFLSLLKKHKSTQIFSSLYITPHYHNLSFPNFKMASFYNSIEINRFSWPNQSKSHSLKIKNSALFLLL